MKRVFRIFWAWNYEKEEKWLNDMSRQGWQLQKYTPFVYHFVRGEEGEYQYCLEFMDSRGGSRGMEDYLQFLRDSGIECVGRHYSWGYFRRKNDGTPFELFSDIASRVAHLDRILTLMGTFLFLLGYSFVSFFLTGLDEGFSLGRVLILFGLYLPALILGGSGILGLLRKRKDMVKEKMYRD